ncbi:MAG: methionine--tRNA ligase [Rickettsiales bacterium]|jgi:methionyl-tRNA synthetase|nr:methionine--tRNA ligase [Rickettsiales bacterium]
MSKILITSALPYVNGIPHLGHLAGCFLPSDAYARYNRLVGNEVLFIGGTDEHGTPSELGAIKENMDVYDYVTKYYELHKKIYEHFGISFDYFGRTSSPNCTELTQRIARECNSNGYIEEREVEQMYSVDEGRFLADRYIIGTCPYCGADNARGDQCEACTKVLEPKQLLNPRSAITGSVNLEFRKTRHLYLRLPLLAERLREWISGKDWNKLTRGIAFKWLDEGLAERSITRDLKWGVPVPVDVWPDMAGKVFYVWFDAPIGYISITRDLLGEGYLDWWQKPSEVKYVEFMGKDNVPFHTIFFPAMLMASGENWKLVDELKGLSYLNFNGGKFSKSAHRGVFADDAIAEFPDVDVLRWWIMKNLPETDDSDFTFERLAEDVNKDLNDVLGNLALRVCKFYGSKFGPEVVHAAAKDDLGIAPHIEAYHKYMEAMEFRKAILELRAIWVLGNEYIDAKAPWSLYKTSPEEAGAVLARAMEAIIVSAALALPFIPTFAQRILDIFGVQVSDLRRLPVVAPGMRLAVPERLFEKIPQERVDELNAKYNK